MKFKSRVGFHWRNRKLILRFTKNTFICVLIWGWMNHFQFWANYPFKMPLAAETCFSKQPSTSAEKIEKHLFPSLSFTKMMTVSTFKAKKQQTIISALPELLKHFWQTHTAKHKSVLIHSPKWYIMNNLCAWSERPFKTIKWQTTRHILSTFKRLPNKRSNGSAPAKTSSRLVFWGGWMWREAERLYCLSVVAASRPRQTEAQVKMLEWCQSATYHYSNAQQQ